MPLKLWKYTQAQLNFIKYLGLGKYRPLQGNKSHLGGRKGYAILRILECLQKKEDTINKYKTLF